jgi:hypothetical protein
MKTFSSVCLLLITVVYLLLELGFNVRLIDVTSGTASEDEFNAIEFHGRVLSSFGLALIVFKLGYRKRPQLFFFISLVIIPTFFFAQKMVIDAVTYAQNNEDKMNAALLMNLRAGMANGQIQLEDIALSHPDTLTSHQRSFLVALGPLTYNNASLTGHLKTNYEHLLNSVATNEANRQRAEFYNNIYVPLNKSVAELYEGYQGYSNEFSKLDHEINEKLDHLWLQYMSAVKSAADNTRTLRQHVDTNMSRLVRLYQSSAIKIANARTQNNTADSKFDTAKGWMATSIRQVFNKSNINLSIPRHDPDIFDFSRDNACQRQSLKNGQQAMIRIRAQKPNGRMSDVKASINGRESVICHIDSRPSNIRKWAYEDFGVIAQYNYGITHLNQDTVGEIIGTRSGWDIMQKVLAAARLPKWTTETQDWRGDRNTFNALTRASLAETSPLMDDMHSKLGIRVKPGLSFESFVQSEDVQTRIRKEIGDNESIAKIIGDGPILMNQPINYFKIAALKNHIVKLSNDYLNEIRASVESGSFDSGKAIKSIWIPFIAMAISLFMFSLNATLLLVNGLMMPFSKPSMKVRLMTLLFAIMLIVGVPMMSPSPFDETEAYSFLLNTLHNSNGLMAYVIDWSMRAQPMLYPLGKPLSGVFSQIPHYSV